LDGFRICRAAAWGFAVGHRGLSGRTLSECLKWGIAIRMKNIGKIENMNPSEESLLVEDIWGNNFLR
jgi:hypothetical protein